MADLLLLDLDKSKVVLQRAVALILMYEINVQYYNESYRYLYGFLFQKEG
jgi:hypothetical protein